MRRLIFGLAPAATAVYVVLHRHPIVMELLKHYPNTASLFTILAVLLGFFYNIAILQLVFWILGRLYG